MWWIALICAASSAPGQLEPIRASYDAIPGQPLILAVRPENGRRPKAEVTLRFPDGREITGSVAAVRLAKREGSGRTWLPPGANWEVLGPGEAGRDADTLAWFVLADLPDGVIGQEVWLDGQPIALRWLPRPRLLAARLGFNPDSAGANPLADPWASPLPESWQTRPDLIGALAPALSDPLRRWRARLAVRGLHPESDRGVGPITPELLGSGLVEASARTASLAERLLDAVAAHNEARWRIALAGLWAADGAISLRVRHALAGAGLFGLSGAGGETAVVPVWNADDRAAGVLLEMLIDDALAPAERAVRAEAWLERLADLALWVIDDGVRSGGARIGAMYLRAGDTTAITLGAEGAVTRPELLTTRHAGVLRPGAFFSDQLGRTWYDARIAGRSRRLAVAPGPVALEPPGLDIPGVWADYSMISLLAPSAELRAVVLGDDRLTGVLTRATGAPGAGSGWRVRLRFVSADDETRLWIGPSSRTKGVVTFGPGGGVDLQRFDRAGAALGDPAALVSRQDDGTVAVEMTLPSGSVEPDGTLHIGLELVGPGGDRWSWPRPMLPWQIEPARRVVDTKAWMGGLEP